MSLEHSPVRTVDGAGPDAGADGAPDIDYWNCLIPEKPAGGFLDLTDRTMQAFRQKGGGPRYIVISSRCIRYRRSDLREWADARMRSSTSDPGPAADAT